VEHQSIAPNPAYALEDEIDLRQYVAVLLKYWRVIAGMAVVGAALAFVISSLLPRQYEATALVVVTSPRYILSFEPKIETASGAEAQRVNPKAYLGLATSDDLLNRLLADPATASWKPEQRTLEAMRGGPLEAKAGADPTLLQLQVTDADPARAAAVANAWAALFVRYVNEIYSRGESTQAFFDAQVTTAKADYDAAQRAVEEFLGDNRVAELQREIDARQTLIDQYQSGQTASWGEAINQQMQSRRQILANYYSELADIEQLLADARALREQVQEGGQSAAANTANTLSLVLLRNRAFGGGAETNLQLQLSLAQAVEPVTLADVESLIVVLEARKADAQTRIDALSAGLLTDLQTPANPPGGDQVSQLIKQYSDEVLALTAQLEAEETRQRELTQARDLAWETYTSLARKAEETRIAVQGGEAEVQLASTASVPAEPAGPRRMLSTLIAGAIVLIAGVFGAFGWEWWTGGPASTPTRAMTGATNDQRRYEAEAAPQV